jgi:diguanylate cyclase (GGDEF)-like protein/PAS domain S-box-containing protein
MRRTCPYLLGALLIALVCLGGGLAHLDRLLAPVTAWIAAWLPAAEPGQLATPPPMIAIRELALLAAAACLALGPLLYRWSFAWGLLAVAAWTGLVLAGVALASYVGIGAAPPGPLVAAGLAAFATATLLRHVDADEGSEPARSGRAGRAALMPPLAERSTAAILTFDCDGRIRSCNPALGQMFGYAADDLVGTSFGQLLEVADRDQPRLFRRGDGPVRALVGRRRSGQRMHLQAALSSLEWQGERLRVAVLHDVSEVMAENALLALRDEATGLCNRVLFYDRIDQAILAAERTQQATAVFVIHLNLFRLIGDTLGEAFAAELIGALISRIQDGLRRSDTLARLGDAELGLLVPGLARAEHAAASAERIAELTRQPFAVQGLEVGLEVNIGVAVYPLHGHDKHALVQRAEAAMLQARRTQQAVVLEAESGEGEDEAEGQLRDDLRAAIENDRLTVQFLPKLSVATERLVGVEALVRWEHPEHGQIATARFLRLAEDSGLILPLTLRVLRLTLEQQRAWRSENWDLAVAINLAGACLQNPQFANLLAHVLQTGEGRAERLVFEVTESALTSNQSRVLDALQRLAAQGCQLSLDDFGTGSFSLSFLRKLPIHELKIDCSFVQAMKTDPDAAAIVRSAISLGQSLELRVVAEGVEDGDTLGELRRLGCDEVQGYLIGPPMTAAAFAGWLQQSGCVPAREPASEPVEVAPDSLSAA